MTNVSRHFPFFLSYLGTRRFFFFRSHCVLFPLSILSRGLSIPVILRTNSIVEGISDLVCYCCYNFLGSMAPHRCVQRGCVLRLFVSLFIFIRLLFPPLFFIRTKICSMGVAKHRSRLWALWGVFRFYFLDSVGLHFFGREESKGKRGK